MKKIKSFKFSKVYDLQNSSRSKFYKKILFPKASSNIWSSTETTIDTTENTNKILNNSVLDRFDYQLNRSGIKTVNVLKPDFSWSCEDISFLIDKYKLEKYILIFPFSSPHLTIKRWPYYNDLIKKIKQYYKEKYQVITAPAPNEIDMANKLNTLCILNNDKALNITQLSSLIKQSAFVIANDTGPAHMAAHLNVKGLALFGSHTTARKVSIERDNFKAIQVSDLTKLSADKVFQRMLEAIS